MLNDLKKVCDKDVSTHSSTTQFVPECYKTFNKRFNKAFNKRFLAFIYIPDQYKTQEMCCIFDRVISQDSFSIRYVPVQYMTQNNV